ncbi:transmembrane protein 26-like [Lytechinus pictus]|uniref:transmembrane protein 26-like n=1 Tax=Lytechinus pictus TaxID=7653 RepID=UPI0030BA0A1A
MRIRRCRFFFKAAISRLLFISHGAVVCFWLYLIREDEFVKYFGIPLLLLPVEMIITLRCTKHGEWKWFSPALMLYLLCVIPGIGFLHVDIHQRRMERIGNPEVPECERIVKNFSSFPDLNFGDYTFRQDWVKGAEGLLKLNDWPEVLEQSTMFLVILGRWMLPKGNLSKEQLSQLLLVYLGMAADILEFSSESLAQPVVACDLIKISIVVGFWGMSLCQFALVLTSVAGPKIRNFRNKKKKRQINDAEDIIEDPNGTDVSVDQETVVKRPSVCGSEIWSLLIVLFLQDCPFLAMRLYLIIKFSIVDRAMLFFSGKNFLVFMLVTYRIFVLCGEHNTRAKVRPVPLVGVHQQPPVGAFAARKRKSRWSLGPRVSGFTNSLMNRAQALDRDIRIKIGLHIPSKSDGPPSTSMTSSPVALEGHHSVEVTEVDYIDSVTPDLDPDTTETAIIDTSRSMPSSADEGKPTTPRITKPDGVGKTDITILKPDSHGSGDQTVIEIESDSGYKRSLSEDSIESRANLTESRGESFRERDTIDQTPLTDVE